MIVRRTKRYGPCGIIPKGYHRDKLIESIAREVDCDGGDTIDVLLAEYSRYMEYMEANSTVLPLRDVHDFLKELYVLENTFVAGGLEITMRVSCVHQPTGETFELIDISEHITAALYNAAEAVLETEDHDVENQLQEALFYLVEAQKYTNGAKLLASLVAARIGYLELEYHVNEFLLLLEPTEECEKTISMRSPMTESDGRSSHVLVDVPPLELSDSTVGPDLEQIQVQESPAKYQETVIYHNVPEQVVIGPQTISMDTFREARRKAFEIQRLLAKDTTGYDFFRECDKIFAIMANPSGRAVNRLLAEQVTACTPLHTILGPEPEPPVSLFFDSSAHGVIPEISNSDSIRFYRKNHFALAEREADYLNQFGHQYNQYVSMECERIKRLQLEVDELTTRERATLGAGLDELELPAQLSPPQLAVYEHDLRQLYGGYKQLLQTDEENSERFNWDSAEFQQYIIGIIHSICACGEELKELITKYHTYCQLDYGVCKAVLDTTGEMLAAKQDRLTELMREHHTDEITTREYPEIHTQADLLRLYNQFGLDDVSESTFKVLCTEITSESQQLAKKYQEEIDGLTTLETAVQQAGDDVVQEHHQITLARVAEEIHELCQLTTCISRLELTISSTISWFEENLQSVGRQYKLQIEEQFKEHQGDSMELFVIEVDRVQPPLQTDLE